jgi:cobalt-zinc-cadmium efflux system outer membrane protein
MLANRVRWFWGFVGLVLLVEICHAQTTENKLLGPVETPARPEVITPETAIRLALERNPELAAVRQRAGIAAAEIVIARTYPFNPAWEGKVFGVSAPDSAGVTNRVPNEHKLLFELEIRGQGKYRQQVAHAALSRTEWEIAFQETTLAVRVARAFYAALYRQEKLKLVEDTIRLNEEAAKQVASLIKKEKLRSADAIVVRADINESRAQLSAARAALATAHHEIRRAIGGTNSSFELQGSLDFPSEKPDIATMMRVAFAKRADLHARQTAVTEAEARVRLETANRFGNPTVGPAYVYDPTRINFIGAHFTMPLPLLNRRQGEIQQKKAEHLRAVLELRNAEESVHHDLQQALARLDDLRAGVTLYQTKILPELRTDLKEMERLFLKEDPAVEFSKLMEFRHRVLKSQDGYLDALFELSQAQADLAAAVGEPVLAIDRHPVRNIP